MTSLKDMLLAGITQLTVVLRGEADPEKLFEDVATRRSVGERLRRDVWMFGQLLRAFIAKARVTPGAPDQWAEQGSVQYVREFLGYFRTMGCQLLYASKYPQFDRFVAAFEGLHEADFLEPARFSSAISECEVFQKFLAETFERISQREENKHATFDKRAAAETLKLYLGAGL